MKYKLSEQELKDLMHRTWLKAKKFYSGKTDEYFYDHFESEKKQLTLTDVVVELPSKNSREFKDWLKSEGYKNKGFGIYQKENIDYCYKLLYKHYCNVLEFGN